LTILDMAGRPCPLPVTEAEKAILYGQTIDTPL